MMQSLRVVCVFAALTWSAGANSAESDANRQEIAAAQQRLEEAQAQLEKAAREVAELNLALGLPPQIVQFRSGGPNRAALGINIGNADNTREEGVAVVSVSPGGPAAAAGLRAGDVITSLNGQTLRRENGRSPQTVLFDVMRSVEPGSKVTVEYSRDGRTARSEVIAQPPAFTAFAPPDMLVSRGMRFAGQPGVRVNEDAFEIVRGLSGFGAIELVSLTPKLGQYFGTDKGLLVISAPQDSRWGLEEGDVILDIAGRVPTSPAHAMRILSSYQPGEKLDLHIMRQRKRSEISIDVPPDDRRGGPGRMFEAPVVRPLPPGVGGGVLFDRVDSEP